MATRVEGGTDRCFASSCALLLSHGVPLCRCAYHNPRAPRPAQPAAEQMCVPSSRLEKVSWKPLPDETCI